MQLIEAALAFAITMLVLSLIVSSFVELIHRFWLMREAGLKYMLGQIFDQVLVKYVKPWAEREAAKFPDFKGKKHADDIYAAARESFVQRMSANRVPMGVEPRTTELADNTTTVDREIANNKQTWAFGLLGGRDLTSLTPAEFMERLGSMDVGKELKDAAAAAGTDAANTVDHVLTDIAQKFEAFGKEAGSYFEGRARLLSVCVAIVLAFAIRVDAIELFNTYLRDPSARNNVIEQTQAVTAQYKAAKDAAEALEKISKSDNPPPSADVKAQVEALQKQWQSTVDSTRATVKQYSDLGLPIGWTKQNATLNPDAATCSKGGVVRVLVEGETCDGVAGKVGLWSVLKLICSLVLGGILIGLGGPFWANAVTGLTNIRSIAKDIAGTDQQKVVSAVTAPQVTGGATPDRAQPATPVGAFNVSQAAAAAASGGGAR